MNDRYLGTMVSLYTLAYHSEHYRDKIFDDYAAISLLSRDECKQIPANLVAGMRSVSHDETDANEALRRIVDTYFSPAVLASAAICEDYLKSAAEDKIRQFVSFGAGMGTFSCRQPLWASDMRIFEVEQSHIVFDKRRRISNGGITIPLNVFYISSADDMSDSPKYLETNYNFQKAEKTFVTMPYITMPFTKSELSLFLMRLAPYLASGSRIMVEYPKPPIPEGYTDSELSGMLQYYELIPKEILSYDDINNRYFDRFNSANPDTPIYPPANIGFCLAEKA